MPGELIVELVNVFTHGFKTGLEEADVVLDVLSRPLGNLIEVCVGKNDHGLAHGNARGAGHAGENRVSGLLSRRTQAFDRACRLRKGDDRRELSRQRDEEGLFTLVEASTFALLHHQYPEHCAVMNDRHAKEGVKFLITGVLQIKEARVLRGVTQIDRFGMLRNQANKTLAGLQAYAAHRFGLEALRGHQYVGAHVGVEQIDRAHLCAERGTYARDNQLEC